MYKFFKQHRLIRGVLDWIVIFCSTVFIFSLFPNVDLSDAWFIPIYLNLFVVLMFSYTQLVHEPLEKRMNLSNWMNSIRWINGIGLILHTTIGYYSKSHKQVVQNVWGNQVEMIVVTISLYSLGIVIPSLIIWFKKYRQV